MEDMVTDYMTVPGHVAPRQIDADFVMSGLRACLSANPVTRCKILSDISDIIACAPTELEFLFAAFEMPIVSSANYEVMVPDFQRELLAVAE